MSLYYDAVSILTESDQRGSLKSRVYAKDANLKSKPAHVYALISETAKYDTLLKEIVDNAEILAHEPKLAPVLALLLVHDHFFSKGGIAAGASHPLRQSIERHKARLQSEFTKARLKRRISTVEELKRAILKQKGISTKNHPRWARVNTLKQSFEDVVEHHFSEYEVVDNVETVMSASKDAKILHHDLHVPNLLAFPPDVDLTKHRAYLDGEIILQDKASCFPAHLLIGTDAEGGLVGDVLDGCAAPGNKTTHAAALVHGADSKVYACERDAIRTKTLQTMVDKAGAGRIVTVLGRQDFLALDPNDKRFANITHLLLDPSCSGSGILGRKDVPVLDLPDDPRAPDGGRRGGSINSKKRKRNGIRSESTNSSTTKTTNNGETNHTPEETSDEPEENTVETMTKSRLTKLSNLQCRIVEHAFCFPSARRITYSTCSVHAEENESVVARVLASPTARSRGWTVLQRSEQVDGLRTWDRRGIVIPPSSLVMLTDEQREACIRCSPDDSTQGTMGFFVCAFVRQDPDTVTGATAGTMTTSTSTVAEEEEENGEEDGEEIDGEWAGFSDP